MPFVAAPNIRHLAAVAATVRHGSLTAAARAVHLTQPALTQAIARLEGELDCTLFERGAGGMRPTEPALLLAPRVDTAIELIGSSRVTGTQIRAFLAVARAGGFSAATERTGLSAASLHRSVNDLSLALGQRLIEKRGRGIVVTRAGERRARAFGLAMAELRSGLSEVAAWQGRAAGRIVIGAMPLSRARWLPASIAAFRPSHPGVEISVVEGSHAEMIGPLRDGEVDFLLGALRTEDSIEDIVQEEAFIDRPQIIMRKGHPLEGHPPTALELTRYPWVLPSPDTPLRRYWETMLRDAGISPPRVDLESGSVLTAREIMLRTEALTLLSRDQLRVELDAGLLISIAPPSEVARSIGIFHRNTWHPTRPQADLIEILRREARNLS